MEAMKPLLEQVKVEIRGRTYEILPQGLEAVFEFGELFHALGVAWLLDYSQELRTLVRLDSQWKPEEGDHSKVIVPPMAAQAMVMTAMVAAMKRNRQAVLRWLASLIVDVTDASPQPVTTDQMRDPKRFPMAALPALLQAYAKHPDVVDFFKIARPTELLSLLGHLRPSSGSAPATSSATATPGSTTAPSAEPATAA